MYTDLTVKCMDQTLQLTNTPRIAAGGVNVVRVVAEFDDKWLGLGRTAVFYRDPKDVYHVLLADGVGVVPWEVLAEPGRLYFGIVGFKDAEVIRTTEVLTLIIEEGAPSEPTATPTEPSATVYEQVLEAYGSVEGNVDKARIAAEAAAADAAQAAVDAAAVEGVAEEAKSTAANAMTAAAAAEAALAGCWIEFTDEEGNPTDEPYIHWLEVQ